MPIWSGRFSGKLDPLAWQLNASLSFDRRLAGQDVRGSLVWAQALEKAGVLEPGEALQITKGLQAILEEIEQRQFNFLEEDEDIHSAVERRLKELIGSLGGKLHTGRSRNDQVATDFRLWILEKLPEVEASLATLQRALLQRAESDLEVVMPGYTHLQRAQPILLSHWWLSHFWPLQRDRQRLGELARRTAVLPLGSGALAGTSYPIDRSALAEALGFDEPSPNSIDGVSDRDFAAELLFAASLAGVHASRLSEMVVLFSSAEFGFFEQSDAYSTGSSLMPQKKNPDVFELGRGKAGALIGSLSGLLATLKGLPSAYDKDLQEDKVPVFAACDTITALFPVLAGAISSLKIHPDRMRGGLDASTMATDLADYLVSRGVPFREAHALVGKAVQLAAAQQLSLDALPLVHYQSLHPAFDKDVYVVFDPEASIARRSAIGGTALQSVLAQIEQAKELLVQPLFTAFPHNHAGVRPAG
jgi:argininosuccinate lyase